MYWCKDILSISFGFFAGLAALSFSLAADAAPSPYVKRTCPPRQLENKNCTLNFDGTDIQVTKKKIISGNRIFWAMLPMPLTADGVKWDQVSLLQLGKRLFLEIYFWDLPKGTAAIQKKLWYLIEIREKELHSVTNGEVQKRRPARLEEKKNGQGADKSEKYIYDPEEKHGLTVDKQGRIMWSLGKQSHEVIEE